jgi:hypothetical protein
MITQIIQPFLKQAAPIAGLIMIDNLSITDMTKITYKLLTVKFLQTFPWVTDLPMVTLFLTKPRLA